MVDGISGQTQLSVRNDGDYVFATTGEDLDGDDIDELVFASGATLKQTVALTVADSTEGSIRWQFHTTKAPYSIVAHGDIDGDGNLELITANRAAYASTLAVFDVAGDTLLWRSPPESPGNEVWETQPLAVALRERPDDIGMDIVVAGNWLSSWRIYALDGVTKNTLLDIRGLGGGPLAYLSLIDMTLADHDGDGLKEIAMLARDQRSDGGLAILLWDMQGKLIWQSESFGDFSTVAHSLLALPDGVGSSAQLLAVLANGIRAFDVENGQESWQLSMPTDGAAFVAFGQAGPELATYSSDGRVWFYDATSRALLRQRQFPAPLRSLQALNGQVHALLAAAGDSLVLVDGRSGEVRSESAVLSPFWRSRQPISAAPVGSHDWLLACPTPIALYRLRLETPDEIFAYGFE